ncbi:hypothetical protein CLOM_g15507 [Closterium sp. NIES-68]|nr:hypothetical protein CLOM_g15507 [Closterium sp. NIES-68]
MAAAAEPRTLERLCSTNFAKHLIAPLQRASSLLGSGDLWQMHADADDAAEAAAAAQGGADGTASGARRFWKISTVVERIESSLSRFAWSKPPLAPTALGKPLKSLRIVIGTTRDSPTGTLSPTSPSPASRRFKQRGSAEAQIKFRVSPSPLGGASGISESATTTTSRNKGVTFQVTKEEPIGGAAPIARRSRACMSMDDEQLSAWQQEAAATLSDDDRDNGNANATSDSEGSSPTSPEAEKLDLDLGNLGRADVSQRSAARVARSSRWCTQSGPLARRSHESHGNGNSRIVVSPNAGSGRGGSSRAMVVGVSRSLTPPASPTVKTFSFESYRQQMTAQ